MGKRRRKHPVPLPNGHANGQVAALSPDSTPANPDAYRSRTFPMPSRVAGVRVTEHTALTLIPVWSCVRVITDALASLPMGVFRRRPGGGRTEAADNPIDWLLGVQSNPETPAFFFRETMLAWALLWGNAYAEIERDGAGRPVWFWPLTPDRVLPHRMRDGRLVYVVYNPRQPDTVLEADDTLHLKGLGFDGLQGYSVVAMCARAIGVGLALEEYAGAFFANDATPGGALKTPNRLSEMARQNLRESWGRKHTGPGNARQLAIMEEGLTFERFSVPNNDAQFLESRNFGIPEICRIFKVPPHKVADLSRATFSNIEEQEIEFVVDCLHPWAARFEAECNVKLFGRTNRGQLYVLHNFRGRMRGNAQARAAYYQLMLNTGVYSVNEVRQLEDHNPIGADGDKRFVPMNMQLLARAGEEPPPPKPGAFPGAPPPPAAPDDGGGSKEKPDKEPDGPPELSAALLPVFTDALARVLRRETHRAADLAKRNADPADWLAEHEEYVVGALRAPALALALLLAANRSVLDVLLPVLAADHLDGLRDRLTGEPRDWETLAPDMAAAWQERLTAGLAAAKGGGAPCLSSR